MSTKQTIYFFVLALLLLTIEINGTDFGLPGFITGKRVGVILLTQILFLQPRKCQKTPAAIQWTIRTLYFVTFWVSLSCLLSDSVSLGGAIGAVISWALVAYCVYAFDHILPRVLSEDKQCFVRAMVGVGFLVNLLTVLWLVGSHGFNVFLSPFTLRHALDDYLVCGMNRYLNGMFFWNMFPIAVLLGVAKTNPRIYALSMAASVSFCLLSLLTACRQTTAAIILYMFVLTVMRLRLTRPKNSRVRRRSRRSWFRIALGVGALFYALFTVLSSENMRYTLHRKIIEKTQTQYETESQGRIAVVRDAWETGLRYPFFGVGDYFRHEANSVGMYTHNGYARLLVENGFPPVIALLALFFGSLMWALFGRKRTGNHSAIWRVAFSFLIVFLVWSVNLNDILNEHLLFFSLSLMIYSLQCATAIEQPGPGS